MASWLVVRRFISTTRVPAAPIGRLTGRVAVVTASTAGIGFAVAQRLGREGAKVVISSRNKENVDTALERLREDGLEAYGVVCHVGLAEQRANLIKEAVSKYGGLDILVSNAGTNPGFEPVLKCTEEKWNKIMDTNVKSGFFLAKEAYPYLKKSVHGPSIVFNSSIGGYEPLAGLGIYSISKTALLALPGVLAKEWGPQIRVNAVAPGIVKTKFSQALWTNKSLMQKTESMIPLRSLATPEQIAGTVAFLVSEDASYITGETIAVAGGLRSRL